LDVSESAASAEFSTCTPNAPQPATYPSKQVTFLMLDKLTQSHFADPKHKRPQAFAGSPSRDTFDSDYT
jgi:hypothetical protein